MALYIYEDFLTDLLNKGDAKFPRRVLSKVIDENANFLIGREDHEYKGIPDAKIRYVSVGAAAIRVIYLQKGSDIYLYRAGPHSVEDNLAKPKASANIVPVKSTESDGIPPIEAEEQSVVEPIVTGELGRFYENCRPEYIRDKLLNRRFTKHRSITLISPYITKGLFSNYSAFGKVLHDLREEGASICLITRPPADLTELKFFERLEAEKIDVLFHETLHAKVYIFETDSEWLNEKNTSEVRSLALIGSADLTAEGIAISNDGRPLNLVNEELVYELPQLHVPHALDYAAHLVAASYDVAKQRSILTSQKNRNSH